MEDHHVDRPEVEGEQSLQPTGTNRSNAPPAPSGKDQAAPAAAGSRPGTAAPFFEDTHTTRFPQARPGPAMPPRAPPPSCGRRDSLVAMARGPAPDPIPNSAVKTLSADGTAAQAAEE